MCELAETVVAGNVKVFFLNSVIVISYVSMKYFRQKCQVWQKWKIVETSNYDNRFHYV